MEPTDVLPGHRADARSAWRRAIGHVLRRRREQVGLRLTDVARRAGVSPQYLSEVERGRKEASSEILAAVTAALGLTLPDLADGVAVELSAARTLTLGSAPAGGRLGLAGRSSGSGQSSGSGPSTRSGPSTGSGPSTPAGRTITGRDVMLLAA